jgi:hypothetical protein
MLIVLTQDQDIINGVLSPNSNAQSWAPVNFLQEGGNPTASVALKALLKKLGANEDLCITGHGNDNEIGDENLSGMQSWTWSVMQLANLLQVNLPDGYKGRIVLEVCAKTANSFASKLAYQLGQMGRVGLYIYGYTTGINITKPFPNPVTMAGLQVYVTGQHNIDDTGEMDTEMGVIPGAVPAAFFDAGAAPKGTNPDGDKGGATANATGSKTVSTPADWKTQASDLPANAGQYNIPASKYYVVNETGNIMMATTSPDNTKIDPQVLDVFQEVAVFFAAMTAAITTTPRLGATAPYSRRDYYTIYDYEALEAVVNSSGLFVNVREEDLTYTSKSGSVDFNLELIESLLGVALTDGIGAEGLKASLNAMGKQASFSYSRTGKTDKIANILFVCEYLFGMPIVNVLYFYLNEDQVETVVTSPCVSADFKGYNLTVHKDTFMFVLPDWIKKYANDLTSVINVPAYQTLIAELRSFINTTPVILNISSDAAGTALVTELTVGTSYYLNGHNFGTANAGNKMYISAKPQTIANNTDWTDSQIKFTFVKPATGKEGYIDIIPVSTNKVTESPQSYTFA